MGNGTDLSAPRTTRPRAMLRRRPVSRRRAVPKRTFDAVPDRIDVRDWWYEPTLQPLPDLLVNCDIVPEILDQGSQGACTGFALAAVINFLLSRRGRTERASPRMLYEMARRYDEWPGENYEGSSARGAMKGFVRHGVCERKDWPDTLHGPGHLTVEIAGKALRIPGGAFYRLEHREIRHVHAALFETGAVYCTLMVHAGWDKPGPNARDVSYVQNGNQRTRTLPYITRQEPASDGHAIAIVGYTEDSFIIQNSWGRSWGANGFALLPYEDFLLHATDVWVLQLGVRVNIDLWSVQTALTTTTAGIQRATDAIPLATIRPFCIDEGRNGELSLSGDYWTSEADLQRLFSDLIPSQTANWEKRRIALYLHGGLNSETDVAARVVAFRDVFLANEIYPLHIMWESGFLESLDQLLKDFVASSETRAGDVADWLRKLRGGLLEARDRTIELTLSAPGTALWSEMKKNARLSSENPNRRGTMQLVQKYVNAAMAGLSAQDRSSWEVHVVGHSAGSIFATYAMQILVSLGVQLRTVQFMAPAVTIDTFADHLLPLITNGSCPQPSLYILSDVGERDDTVGPYGKSLLYLVSNAFEGRRDTPLLGMQRFLTGQDADARLTGLVRKSVDGLPSLVVAGSNQGLGSDSKSDSHGGFDNDPATMNSVLYRILGRKPTREFTTTDLQY